MRSVLEHVGLYVGLAVYTAAGAKVFSGQGGGRPYSSKYPRGRGECYFKVIQVFVSIRFTY